MKVYRNESLIFRYVSIVHIINHYDNEVQFDVEVILDQSKPKLKFI